MLKARKILDFMGEVFFASMSKVKVLPDPGQAFITKFMEVVL